MCGVRTAYKVINCFYTQLIDVYRQPPVEVAGIILAIKTKRLCLLMELSLAKIQSATRRPYRLFSVKAPDCILYDRALCRLDKGMIGDCLMQISLHKASRIVHLLKQQPDFRSLPPSMHKTNVRFSNSKVKTGAAA